MSLWTLQLLGGANLGDAHGNITLLERKTAGLLAYLVLEGASPRSVLAGLLWPDTSEAQARSNLRKVLTRLRKRASILEGEQQLTLAPQVHIDVTKLLATDEHVAQVPPVLLAGLEYDDCPDFAEWLLAWRERLREVHVQRLQKESERLELAGELTLARDLAKQLVGFEPLAETHHRRLMRLHYLLGDRASALTAYHHCQEVLARELALEPLPETATLATQIERMAVAIPTLPKRKAIPLSVQRPPLLEREEVWAQLEEAWQQNLTIFISGGAGIGKTRLMYDFAASKGAFAEFVARPGDRSIPYATGVRLFRSELKGEHLHDLEPWVRHELSRLLPDLAEGSPPPPKPEEEHRFLEAWALTVERLTRGTVAIVSDDLHYWDPASFQVGTYLASRFADSPLRSLSAFRPNELPQALRQQIAQLVDADLAVVIELEPLSPTAVSDLVTRLELTPTLSPALYDLTGGNPLYLVESLKSLFEVGEFEAATLPERTSQLISSRLERLSEQAQHLVRAVALTGGDLDLELQGAMLEQSPLVLAESVIELEAAQMLRGAVLSHDLLGETLLKELPEVIKVHLHKRAASYLETFDDRSAQAAEHWLEAGVMERALEQWLKAAQTLYERGLAHEAVQILERTLRHTEHELDVTKIQVKLARLYNEVARYDEAKTLIESILPQVDEPRLRADALYVQGDLLCNEGSLSEAASVIEEGSKLAKYLHDEKLLSDFWGLEEFLAYAEGRYQDAIALAMRQLKPYREGPPSAGLALILSNMGTYYRCLGQLEDAILYQKEARHVAKKVGATQQEFSALANLAGVYHFMGKLEEALALNTEALALGDFYGRDFVRGNQATQLLRLGRYAEAIAVSEVLVREANQIEARILSWTRLSELYSLTGQHDKVSTVLDEAIYLAKGTELVMVRARVVIDVYKFGTEAQRSEVSDMLAGLDLETVPHDMRKELEEIFHNTNSKESLTK